VGVLTADDDPHPRRVARQVEEVGDFGDVTVFTQVTVSIDRCSPCLRDEQRRPWADLRLRVSEPTPRATLAGCGPQHRSDRAALLQFRQLCPVVESPWNTERSTGVTERSQRATSTGRSEV